MALKLTNIHTARDEKGNVIAQNIQERTVSAAPKDGLILFLKMFREDLGSLYKVSKNSIIVFMELASKIKFADQTVYMSGVEKKELVDRTGIAYNSIYNCLTELCKAGLLVRVVPSVFMVNPFIFATGSDLSIIENRQKFKLTLSTTYDVDEDGVCTDRLVQIQSFKGKV